MSVPAPSPPDTDGPRRAWNGVIAIAGAVAGLAVLLYLVGAVTMWARFRAGNLPADIAIDHYPQRQLVALGLRGVFFVAVVIVGFLALAYIVLVAWGYLAARNRRARKSARNPVPHPTLLYAYATRLPQRVRTENVLDATAPTVRRLRVGHFRLLGLAGAVVIIISTGISWKALAVAVGLVTATSATIYYLHERPYRARPSLALIVTTLLAVASAGILWQVQPPVKVQAVRVIPLPEAEGLPDEFLASTEDVSLPYFGETSAQVFVGEITPQTPTETEPYSWKYTGRILEIPRDGVRLIFEEEKGTLYSDLRPPACVVARGRLPYLC